MGKYFKKLSHTLYECNYDIVFCPKYRFRMFEGEIAEYAMQLFYKFCSYKDMVEVLELNIREDHVHAIVSIPPKICSIIFNGVPQGKYVDQAVSKI